MLVGEMDEDVIDALSGVTRILTRFVVDAHYSDEDAYLQALADVMGQNTARS